jgi:PadR family transcriptional regulator, regulatory protein PadR
MHRGRHRRDNSSDVRWAIKSLTRLSGVGAKIASAITTPVNAERHIDYLQERGVDSHSMGKPNDLVQGTLDLLILKTLSLEPKHGWAIAKRIQQISGEVLQVQQGSLYPALHRLEQQALIKAKWAETETGRQAKFYSLTAAGRGRLQKEQAQWHRLSAAIDLVVEGA